MRPIEFAINPELFKFNPDILSWQTKLKLYFMVAWLTSMTDIANFCATQSSKLSIPTLKKTLRCLLLCKNLQRSFLRVRSSKIIRFWKARQDRKTRSHNSKEFNAESIDIKTELQLMQLRVRVRRSDVTQFHSERIFIRDESRESCCIIRNYIR